VNITAVPTVSQMIGVTRVLKGVSVPNILGNSSLPEERERLLRRKYVVRALEILQTEIKEKEIFMVGE
jgi:glycine/betaine/sarcosine/D-proline reductase family selenoprotein B